MSIDTKETAEGLLVITINEPARRNPVSHDKRVEILAVLSKAAGNDVIRAVVLTGAGGNFCAGGDIRDQGARSMASHRERFNLIGDLVLRMARFPKPLVAAVEGWAAGAGFGLALACPTVVASREAQFVSAFTKIGLMPDMGLLSTLANRIGPAKARSMLLDNRVVAGAEAVDLGIADQLAEASDALRLASEVALAQAETAAMPRQFILDWFGRDLAQALEYEQRLQPILLNSADAAEGRAAFAEKRKPVFRGL